jgi:hypothetical protein
MERNVGGRDRAVRLILGAVLVAMSFFVEWRGYWGLAPLLAGSALLLTAMLRYCPINAALHMDSRRSRAR